LKPYSKLKEKENGEEYSISFVVSVESPRYCLCLFVFPSFPFSTMLLLFLPSILCDIVVGIIRIRILSTGRKHNKGFYAHTERQTQEGDEEKRTHR
jgi:hypothetical protein